MINQRLQLGLNLWIPPGPNLSKQELSDMVKRAEIANKAVDCFLHNEIDLETYLDAVEHAEVQMDDYLDSCLENIDFLFDSTI